MKITQNIKQHWTNLEGISYECSLMSTQYRGGLTKLREELQAILKELEVESLEDALNKIIPHIEKNAYIEEDGTAEYRLHISVTQSVAEASEMLTLNSSFYGDDRNGYEYKSTAETAEIIFGCDWDDFGSKTEHTEYVNGKTEHVGPTISSPRFMQSKEFAVLKTARTAGEKDSEEFEYYDTNLCVYIPE